MKPIFHLSLMVSDLDASRRFYETTLNAEIGRVTETWLDVWLFGVQLTLQQTPAGADLVMPNGKFHLGGALPWDVWLAERDRLSAAGMEFLGAPKINEETRTAKMYFQDPDGYVIELKAYRDVEAQLSPRT